jgi:hypothetical protein
MTKERDQVPAISRRLFLHEVVALSLAAGVPRMPASMSGSSAGNSLLTPAQRSLLSGVADRLVPADGTMPGAGELGVAGFLDAALVAAPHLRPPLMALLDSLPEAKAFSALTVTQAERVLARVQQEQREAFDLLLQAIYAGYYSHPAIQRAVGWTDPVDSPLASEPFDIALLNAVLERESARRASNAAE